MVRSAAFVSFIFGVMLSLATVFLFGLLPALETARSDLRGGLAEGAGGAGHRPARNRLTQLLVVSQVALAFVLLIGAGLFIRTLGYARSVDPGFRADGRLGKAKGYVLVRGSTQSPRLRA